jgi:very-short-patch-repair endonuclease
VEVDGGIHDRTVEADAQRERMLAGRGVSVIRVTNDDVLQRLEETLGRIEEALTIRLREREAERSMIPSLSPGEGDGR